MKLLFDHNLSPALVWRLADLFPDSLHVWTLGLDTAPDLVVWDYARDNDLALASKDSDFEDISLIHGVPPRWIWVRSGNATTKQLEAAFRRDFLPIGQFLADPDLSIYLLR